LAQAGGPAAHGVVVRTVALVGGTLDSAADRRGLGGRLLGESVEVPALGTPPGGLQQPSTEDRNQFARVNPGKLAITSVSFVALEAGEP
jgi:hypothetical protein